MAAKRISTREEGQERAHTLTSPYPCITRSRITIEISFSTACCIVASELRAHAGDASFALLPSPDVRSVSFGARPSSARPGDTDTDAGVEEAGVRVRDARSGSSSDFFLCRRERWTLWEAEDGFGEPPRTGEW